MENVSGIIDALCAKLGVTLENLIPAIVEFGTYECQMTIRVCIYILLAGIISVVFAFLLGRKGYDTVPMILFVFGMIAIVTCAVLLIFKVVDLHKWEAFPEMMAYRYILNLLRYRTV